MSRILEVLKKQDPTKTVGELIDELDKAKKEAKLKEDEEFSKVNLFFKDSYLKYYDDDGIFGPTLHILRIVEVTDRHRCEDWSFHYGFKGHKMSFSGRDINLREFIEGRVDQTYSFDKLKKMTRITHDEYMEFRMAYEEISDTLETILENK